jgi:hypothetical protein
MKTMNPFSLSLVSSDALVGAISFGLVLGARWVDISVIIWAATGITTW